MSISTEIMRLQNAKTSLVTTLTNKGVTVPSGTKLEGINTLISNNLIKPSGTITITENGTFDVSAYESAIISLPSYTDLS